MPQGGGGQGGNDSLSRRQKEIIAGTFRLVRDKGIMDPKEYEEGLNALALVQSRLQAQAQSVVDRLLRRGATDVSDEFSRLAQYLRGAIEEMQKAAVDLGAAKPAEALPAEQKALQQLLRAESLFLEIQISFGNQGGGGGGGGGQAADAEDLADLFELELNKLKNQYETVQRGETRQRDQELDEAAERLKELAQRQQQLNERMRNLGQRPGASGSASGGGSESQRRLMDEAEDLARRLQRLSRERSSPELNRVGNQLQQAIQEMRKSLQNRQAGRDAVPQGVRALERLDEAGSALNRERNVGLGRGLENAIDTARELEKEQDRVQADVDDMIRAREGAGRERMEQMGQEVATRKSLMAERLQNLSGTIQDLAREARKDQPETSARLNEAAGTIRDRRLPERILSGNRMLEGGYLDSLKGREEYIRSALNDVSRRLEEARNSVGQTREGNLEDALTRTRRLAEGLESLQRRLQRGGEPGDRATEPGQQAGAQPRPDPSGSQSGEAGRQARKPDEQAGGAQPGGQQGGREREPGGTPGRQNFGGVSSDSFAPPTGIGPYTDDEIRQLTRETQQRLMDATELRRMLDRNSTQLENLERVISQLREIDDLRRYNDPEESARLREAIALMRRLELDLSRELARLTQKDKFLYPDDNEAPNIYRRLVEEYYKALARAGRP